MVRGTAVIRNPDQSNLARHPGLGRRVARRRPLTVLAIGRKHDVPSRIDARGRHRRRTLLAGMGGLAG